MKKLFAITFLLLLIISAKSNNNDYNNYRNLLKDRLCVDVSFPESTVTLISDTGFVVFTFGKMLEELPTNPIFECRAIVKESNDCYALIESLPIIKPSYSQNNKVPVITGWMLNNCDTPWAQWYIENNGGVITQENTILEEEESTLLKEKVSSLRMQYEKAIEGNEVTQKANCSRIYLVKLPYIEKVKCHNPVLGSYCPELETELKTFATECYGVEFCKNPTTRPLRMLFFINGNNTSIEECIANVAEYIRFE